MGAAPVHARRPRFFATVVVVLAAAIGLTMLARHFRTDYVERNVQAQQRAVVADAFEHIEADFAARQEALRRQGEVLSNHPLVTEALSDRLEGVRRDSPALIRHFAALVLPDRWAVELYDPSLELAAWSGFSLAPIEASAERGLQAPHVSVAMDADWRRALAVWHPVRVDGRLLGTVRVVELIHARTTVQNDELTTYRVEDVWQRGIRLPVHLHFDRTGGVDDSARTLSLTGFDGSVLGRVTVDLPKPQRLVELEGRRYGDVAAFWATLLLMWLLAGSWSWYRHSEDITAAGIRLGVFGIALSVGRFVLLALDVPARWQPGKAPLNLLFDPVHVASPVGGGVMRSPGDLLLTALFALVLAFSAFGYAKRYFTPVGEGSATLRGLWRRALHTTARGRMIGGLAATGSVSVGLVALLAVTAHHAVVDGTLDWFARGALIPPPLILIVSCALVITALSVLLLIVSLAWAVIGATRGGWAAGAPFGVERGPPDSGCGCDSAGGRLFDLRSTAVGSLADCRCVSGPRIRTCDPRTVGSCWCFAAPYPAKRASGRVCLERLAVSTSVRWHGLQEAPADGIRGFNL